MFKANLETSGKHLAHVAHVASEPNDCVRMSPKLMHRGFLKRRFKKCMSFGHPISPVCPGSRGTCGIGTQRMCQNQSKTGAQRFSEAEIQEIHEF